MRRKRENDRVGRWNCHACLGSFNVLSGTIMEKTKIPLQKWFLAVALTVNARKSLSSYQLSRDIGVTQVSSWYMMQRIRRAMAGDERHFLCGIVEADECYIGGKPRKRNNRDDDADPPKRGRGTKNVPRSGPRSSPFRDRTQRWDWPLPMRP